MDLHQETAVFRFEWTMKCPGWAASIGIGLESLAALAFFVIADSQVACEQENFLPVLVDKRRGGVDPGREAEQAGSAATLVHLIERA